jgi:putative endonuclease
MARGEVASAQGRPALGGEWLIEFMHYVYILKSLKTGKLYKGHTADLNRRIAEYKAGNSIFTKQNRPWKLVYYEVFSSPDDARREEVFLKTGKGRERIKYLLKSTLEN